MSSFTIISIITFILVAYGAIEYLKHQLILKKIPIRIHVNGTRGKSSVTRLIGAGLRAGGHRSITKVTGTFPRLIMPDGTEVAIYRKEKANILEQLNIIKFCSKQKANVLIIECMALQPQYQKITEQQMVKATIGVITNIRLDHLDVMGPTLDDVAKALSGTIPSNSKFFTAEDRYYTFTKKIAEKRNSISHQSKASTVSDEEMVGFRYIEHKINVALALDICESLGVNREIALAEMKKTMPDEGVLTKSDVIEGGKNISFYNAFAANDPESSLMLWDSIVQQTKPEVDKMILLNTRHDRQDRARQLIEMIASKMQFEYVGLIGESCDLVKEMALKNKVPLDKIVLIGDVSKEEKYEQIANSVGENAIVVGIGNMGAGGAELAKFYEFKSKNK
jgi:poly-gamma-glutamate synthase PgsB/CapB